MSPSTRDCHRLADKMVWRVGYGAMRLAGDGALGPVVDRGDALAVLRAAIDAGVDHIDTAQFYGPDVVNDIIREAPHPYPAGMAIVSKVGIFPSAASVIPGRDARKLRKDIEESSRRDADASVRQQLLDEIAGANPFAVPPSWVNQLIDGYMQAYRIPEEQRDRFAGEFRSIAERQVRRDLIIDTIAEKEGLRATEADLDDRVAEPANKRNADPGQVYTSLQKAGRVKEIEKGLTEEKVFNWLLERNTVE